MQNAGVRVGATQPVQQQNALARDIHQTANARFEVLDNETNKLIDLYGSLLEAASIGEKQKRKKKKSRKEKQFIATLDITVDKKTQSEKDALQIAVCAADIVQSCEGLLQLTSDLKTAYILYDYERLSEQTEEKSKFYRAKTIHRVQNGMDEAE